MALVESRNDSSAEFDDVIAGKGQGLNILLQYGSTSFFVLFSLTCKSGPPGVGKTLTAEAVAELLQLPLYSVCFIVFRLLRLL